jgi:hypothetical protein
MIEHVIHAGTNTINVAPVLSKEGLGSLFQQLT